MNELGQQFGLGGMSMGSPMESMGYPSDPMMNPEVEQVIQQLVAQYGITPEQAFELLRAQAQEQPPQTADILGQPAPQLSPTDYNALAQQFGLAPGNSAEFEAEDPAYSGEYDIANLLGGAYEP